MRQSKLLEGAVVFTVGFVGACLLALILALTVATLRELL